MPSTLELCEKYFETKDLYKLFNIKKDALEKDVKKAYYKISLQVHPDRVPETEKGVATEKFKILSRVYAVLTDKDKRALYDEKEIVDEDDCSLDSTWLDLWRQIFKPISAEDIDNYEKQYRFSDLEKADIKKAYLGGKGCLNYMLDCVPFMNVEDEPRIIDIIKEMIKADEVPEYKIFTKEPKAKRDRRHKKYDREAREAKQIKLDMEKKAKESGSLSQQIMKNQTSRGNNSESFFDKLIAKYGDAADDEEDVFDFSSKKAKKKKNPMKKTVTKKQINHVKSGRVQKKK